MDNCKDCRFFWQRNTTIHVGECRRRSPLVTGGVHTKSETLWPVIQTDAGCGEFEPSSVNSEKETP